MRVRAANAAAAAALRREGYTTREIAATLGVGRRYVYELLYDPDGDKLRERHERARGSCADCGAPTSWNARGSSARCLACSTALIREEQTVWTADAIIAAFRAFAVEHGRPPSPADMGTGKCARPRVEGLPSYLAVRREFGGLPQAREAAGVGHPRIGGPRGPRRKAVPA